MDSRELFKAAEYLRSTLIWQKDWIHYGTGKEIKYDLLDDLIANFLKSDNINIVYNRTNSRAIESKKVRSKIKDLLGKRNFEIWNDSMDRVIQFKQIGVLLKGVKPNET